MADITVTVRSPERLGKLLLWAHENEYKAHITHNVPSQIPDFDGDPVFEPWFEVKLEDRSKRAVQLKEAVRELVDGFEKTTPEA